MRLTTKEISQIQQLESEYGCLANVPEDHPLLISLKRYAKTDEERKFLNKKSEPMTKRKWTQKEKDILMKLREEGKSFREVSQTVGHSMSSCQTKHYEINFFKEEKPT